MIFSKKFKVYRPSDTLVSYLLLRRSTLIKAAGATEAEWVRLGDGTPYLKLGKSPSSEDFALLEVTTDF